MATKLLSNGLDKLRYYPSNPEKLLWHGDTPPAPPLQPSGWKTIGHDLNLTYTGSLYDSRGTSVVFSKNDSEDYFDPMPPPITSPSNYISVSQGVDCSSYVRDQTNMEWRFNYMEWEYSYATVTSFTFPYSSLGVPLNTTLRSNGMFRLILYPVNFIRWSSTSRGTPWNLNFRILGQSFPASYQQVVTSYPTPRIHTFFNAGLMQHINNCLDNQIITPYTTVKPSVSGSGNFSMTEDDWRQTDSLWDYDETPPLEYKGVYYPSDSHSGLNMGAMFDLTSFRIEGYFS